MFTVARQTDSDFEHEARLKGEFFDQRVGNEKIINSRTQVIGRKTKAGAILFTLEEAGCRDRDTVLQAVSNLINHQMTPRKVGSKAKPGLNGALDQCGERELLQLVHHKSGA